MSLHGPFYLFKCLFKSGENHAWLRGMVVGMKSIFVYFVRISWLVLELGSPRVIVSLVTISRGNDRGTVE